MRGPSPGPRTELALAAKGAAGGGHTPEMGLSRKAHPARLPPVSAAYQCLTDVSLCLFQNVDHKLKFRSKKGQLPFIELNGEEIADSSIIIKELAERFEKDLDKDLDNEQKNVAYALTSMIENHLLW